MFCLILDYLFYMETLIKNKTNKEAYSEPFPTFKMELIAKIVVAVN